MIISHKDKGHEEFHPLFMITWYPIARMTLHFASLLHTNAGGCGNTTGINARAGASGH